MRCEYGQRDEQRGYGIAHGVIMEQGTGTGQDDYFKALHAELDRAYALAESAREKKLDPSLEVEIRLAADIAARVEGITGPPGISTLIRQLEGEWKSREAIALIIVKKIVTGEFKIARSDKTGLIEQAVRTGVGILTEGVLVAPT